MENSSSPSFSKVLVLVKNWCTQNDLELDQFPKSPPEGAEDSSVLQNVDMSGLSETQQASYVLFTENGGNLDDVSAQRQLKNSTVVTHLCEALKRGLPLAVEKLGVTEERRSAIEKVIVGPVIDSNVLR